MRSKQAVAIAIMTIIFSGCTPTSNSEVILFTSSLFHEVQMQGIFPDSKTFVDCTPRRNIEEILEDYEDRKDEPGFNLASFVNENFEAPKRPASGFVTDSTVAMEQHITRLWPVLTRKADEQEERSTLIALPNDYVVPGGRFSEIYYWDSYFTILGLKSQERYDLIQSMVKNFTHLIEKVGFIPNGNRTYYLTRSQPPFFSLIVRELEAYDSVAAVTYLPAMEKEYAFWMNGLDSVDRPGKAVDHVVSLSDGTIMNRYYDHADTPRPESYREDYTLGQAHADPKKLCRDIRSAAESGWDFSSRWFKDGKTLSSIHTTDIVPVDLNCLMAHLERMIAKAYILKNQPQKAQVFTDRANQRRRALLTFFWDPEQNFFFDYDWVEGKRKNVKSLAGVFPLFFQLTQSDIAEKVSKVIEQEFLQQGGVVTTLTDTNQQWDSPNGWAPLQWVTYKALQNYGHDKLANTIRDRWLRQNERVYMATGKMMEKYNVLDTTLIAGGGEYPNQDGFGWTNGVALSFLREKRTTLPRK